MYTKATGRHKGAPDVVRQEKNSKRLKIDFW
jgi:hypothetical protein